MIALICIKLTVQSMKKILISVVILFALIVYPSNVFAADTATLQTQLMTYLPYILIGGAAILLISIVGILLSKKKEKDEDIMAPQTAAVVEQPVMAPEETISEVQAPVQPVNMDNVSENLYAPEITKPTIQETMESTPVTEEFPINQPNFAPSVEPMNEQNPDSDLQDILQGEASASPMGPVTTHVMEDANTPVETPAPTTFETPDVPNMTAQFVPTPLEETMPTTTETPVQEFNAAPAIPDLQQFVNNQVAEVPPMAETSIMETPTPMEDTTPVDTTTPPQTGTTFSI